MKILMMIFLMTLSLPVWAEGSCPPGQYPVGGQGVLGCAPIPGGRQGGTSDGPAGRWRLTWGAVVGDGQGAIGVSTGNRSKRDAINEASANCAKNTPKECSVVELVYENSCAGIAVPVRAGIAVGGVVGFSTGVTKEVAGQAARNICMEKNALACEVKYSDCSDSVFEQ